MLVSTQTEKTSERLGDFEAVKLLARTGFDALDYSMFEMREDDCFLNTPGYAAHIREVKTIAEESGVFFNQAHAMFPPMRDGDEAYNEKVFPRIVRALEIGGMLGVDAVVVHPVVFETDQLEKNVAMYERLEPYCKEFGVKVALENMWGRSKTVPSRIIPNVCSTAQDFPQYVDALPEEYFTACLDIGHCSLVGENAPDMIRALGHNRLTALHLHDNDNVSDWHLVPFSMRLPWKEIVKALAQIDYSGIFTLESDGFLRGVSANLLPEAVRYQYAAAKTLADMFEKEMASR